MRFQVQAGYGDIITYYFEDAETVRVSGETFRVRSQLKRLGLVWDAASQSWGGKPVIGDIQNLFDAMTSFGWFVHMAKGSQVSVPGHETVDPFQKPLPVTLTTRRTMVQTLEQHREAMNRQMDRLIALAKTDPMTPAILNEMSSMALEEVFEPAIDQAVSGVYTAIVEHSHPDKTISIPDIHFCPASPVTTCVYDDDADPCHDDCLYCHGPEERK